MIDLYFWTFTFAQALDVKVAARRWSRFLSDPDGLLAAFPQMTGLRVFEMHPGVNGLSHGLHVHFVCDDFLPVDIVRSISTRKGFGRIHVKKIPAKSALYLGKYLAKDRVECMQGMRLWAPVGRADSSRVRDIVVDSRWTAAYRFLASAIGGWTKLAWNQRLHITTHFCMGENIAAALESIGMTVPDQADVERFGHDAWKL